MIPLYNTQTEFITRLCLMMALCKCRTYRLKKDVGFTGNVFFLSLSLLPFFSITNFFSKYRNPEPLVIVKIHILK